LYPIRVLVVDDSFFMRKFVTDILVSSGVIQVIDTARDGLEAINKIKKLSPDVVTMDVEMPNMDGLEALKKIMKEHPLPIIMLSTLTQKGADTTIKALEYGAFDFLSKPAGSISLNIKEIKNELIDKILIAHRQKEKWAQQWNNKKNIYKTETTLTKIDKKFPMKESIQKLHGIVILGTSTGGPKALQEVITNIPKNFPYAILIVQHMPAGFTNSLANRLNSLSKIEVVEASDKQVIKPGVAYIAPGNYHMVIQSVGDNYIIKTNQEEHVGGHRPSVDVLFSSVKNLTLNKIFVIMTGMGSDGKKGLTFAKIKKDDICIVENEESCVVFGMPKSAIQTGLVDMIVPLYHISDKIIESVNKQRGWQSWN